MTELPLQIPINPLLPDFHLPVLGFCARSGTGKTTLLRKVIPELRRQGVRLAVIKHAHHDFEIDYPGKDSYELRHAGASQMIVASASRIAQITEVTNPADDPDLAEMLARLDVAQLDLVLVEGFKEVAFPKIELHRGDLQQPYIFTSDANVIALATDEAAPQGMASSMAVLALNDPSQIATFIVQYVQDCGHLKQVGEE